MTEKDKGYRDPVVDTAKSTIVNLNKLKELLEGTDKEDFAEKPTDFLLGAKRNLEFVEKQLSGKLEEICDLSPRHDKGFFTVNFTGNVRQLLFPKPYVRFCNGEIQFVNSTSNFPHPSDIQKISGTKEVENLYSKVEARDGKIGKSASRTAIIIFGEFSKKEILSKTINAVKPFAKEG